MLLIIKGVFDFETWILTRANLWLARDPKNPSRDLAKTPETDLHFSSHCFNILSRVAVGQVEGLSWSTSLGWWDQISWFTPQRFNLCWRTRGTTKLSKKREDLFESWKEKWETDWRKQQKKSNLWLLNQSPGSSFGQQGGAMRYLSYSVRVSLCSFIQRTWVPCSMRPGGSCGATSINCGLTFSNSL